MDNDFKLWRARLGITQVRAAELLGVSLPAVKKYESNALLGGVPLPLLKLMTVIEDGGGESPVPWRRRK
jgi:DNA-binding XRE family transcriptional regulator